MQKISKIKIGKSITAVLLCVVLLVTSIPMVLAAGEGEYDPIPTFTESDKREAAATLNDDGGITVSFPAAKVSERKTGTKTIDGYMLELVDLGTYTEVHTSTVLLRKMVSPTGTAPYTAEITADEIKTKVPAGLSDDHRYNITITAYDSDGWFSEAVNAYVSDVPLQTTFLPCVKSLLLIKKVPQMTTVRFRIPESTREPPKSTMYAVRQAPLTICRRVITFHSKAEPMV